MYLLEEITLLIRGLYYFIKYRDMLMGKDVPKENDSLKSGKGGKGSFIERMTA